MSTTTLLVVVAVASFLAGILIDRAILDIRGVRMREYGRACERAAYRRAAQLCREIAAHGTDGRPVRFSRLGERYARAILVLEKEK
mgnify:CR=1 FL=1